MVMRNVPTYFIYNPDIESLNMTQNWMTAICSKDILSELSKVIFDNIERRFLRTFGKIFGKF